MKAQTPPFPRSPGEEAAAAFSIFALCFPRVVVLSGVEVKLLGRLVWNQLPLPRSLFTKPGVWLLWRHVPLGLQAFQVTLMNSLENHLENIIRLNPDQMDLDLRGRSVREHLCVCRDGTDISPRWKTTGAEVFSESLVPYLSGKEHFVFSLYFDSLLLFMSFSHKRLLNTRCRQSPWWEKYHVCVFWRLDLGQTEYPTCFICWILKCQQHSNKQMPHSLEVA